MYVPRLKSMILTKMVPRVLFFYLFRPEGLTSKNLSFNLE